MGQTRVDLLHLLEDLRDAYPGADAGAQRYHAHEAAMASTTRRLATEEDLRNTPDDGIYELVDGSTAKTSSGASAAA